MSSVNPYAPPGAAVGDIHDSRQYQAPRLWSASGRIGRLRYLAYTTGGYLVLILASAALGLIAGALHVSGLLKALPLILAVPYIIFCVLMLIQRSHDMDWTGWSILAALIPLVGLIWLFKGGSEGENRFGPPPPPNTTGVKVLAIVFPLIFVIGIVAAIALPAYHQYTLRAKAAAEAQRNAAPQPGQQQ